ncbi:hypothetical protein L288_02930 [Sphingobium quisquiliarum P25]|uniref:Universal stress protein n=1 Tax=Sphingobium quisquiliarum P25 TaxID=1329909 RepID=T0H6Y7_9SPHN|nr:MULTISPECIES: universal stress protein [Sphingobium]EQB12106.1 hypothetical protein L288_02930 [Sphingobium quisquiliarum P25]EZP70455.1 Universal stress protein [Sphingomonas paucimobilis]
MAFSSILVAIDINDHDHARSALEAARALSVSGAKVHILYVRYFLPVNYEGMITVDFDTQEIGEAQRLIDQWKVEFGLEKATFVSRRGRVRDEVLDEAQHIGADLIVIGSHQPSLSSRVLGSNAAAIVRNSPISVLIARQGKAA